MQIIGNLHPELLERVRSGTFKKTSDERDKQALREEDAPEMQFMSRNFFDDEDSSSDEDSDTDIFAGIPLQTHAKREESTSLEEKDNVDEDGNPIPKTNRRPSGAESSMRDRLGAASSTMDAASTNIPPVKKSQQGTFATMIGVGAASEPSSKRLSLGSMSSAKTNPEPSRGNPKQEDFMRWGGESSRVKSSDGMSLKAGGNGSGSVPLPHKVAGQAPAGTRRVSQRLAELLDSANLGSMGAEIASKGYVELEDLKESAPEEISMLADSLRLRPVERKRLQRALGKIHEKEGAGTSIQSKLSRFLLSANLSSYAEKLGQSGYIELEDLIDAETGELEELVSEIGMKKVEKRRLKRAISDLREKKKSFG